MRIEKTLYLNILWNIHLISEVSLLSIVSELNIANRKPMLL